MDNNLENIARSMLKSMGGEKLSEKMSELNKLAESKDAQNLKQKLGDGSEILKAAQKGDSQTLQCFCPPYSNRRRLRMPGLSLRYIIFSIRKGELWRF